MWHLMRVTTIGITGVANCTHSIDGGLHLQNLAEMRCDEQNSTMKDGERSIEQTAYHKSAKVLVIDHCELLLHAPDLQHAHTIPCASYTRRLTVPGRAIEL